MKEKDLIKLGFKKIDVPEEESGDKPYYYYTFDFFSEYCGLSLLSNSDDEVEDGNLYPSSFCVVRSAGEGPFIRKHASRTSIPNGSTIPQLLRSFGNMIHT